MRPLRGGITANVHVYMIDRLLTFEMQWLDHAVNSTKVVKPSLVFYTTRV